MSLWGTWADNRRQPLSTSVAAWSASTLNVLWMEVGASNESVNHLRGDPIPHVSVNNLRNDPIPRRLSRLVSEACAASSSLLPYLSA